MNIVREPRKSFAAEVVPDGAVTIKAPLRAGDAEINAFIERKTKWIEKQQAYCKQFNRPEQFEIISGAPPKTAQINADFQKWRLRRAEDVFAERLRECLKSFPDLPTPVLKIRKLKKRWGSYLKKHEIILNPDLIKANKKSIDYVIFHELCHACFPNHSDGF